MKCTQQSFKTLVNPCVFIAVLVIGLFGYVILYYTFIQRVFTSKHVNPTESWNTNFKMSLLSKDLSKKKYFIYFCDGSFLCGGWADRIKGMFAAYLIANVTGRIFKIHMDVPCDITNYLLPNLVDWKINKEELSGKTSNHFIAISNDEFLKSSAVTYLNSIFKEDVIYFSFNLDIVPFIRRNPHYIEALQWMEPYSNAQLHFHLFRELFHLKPEIKQKLFDFKLKIPVNSRLFCAQIRIGRNPSAVNDSEVRTSNKDVQLIWDFFRQLSKSDFPQTINLTDHESYDDDHYVKKGHKQHHRLRNLGHDVHYSLFVTSDSEEMRSQAKKLFPKHLLDLPGDLVHIERSSGSKVKLCNGFGKVILDQLVLGYCDTLVITKSGFGEIAAYMRLKNDNLYCLRYSRLYRCYLHDFDFDLIRTLKFGIFIVITVMIVVVAVMRYCISLKNKK